MILQQSEDAIFHLTSQYKQVGKKENLQKGEQNVYSSEFREMQLKKKLNSLHDSLGSYKKHMYDREFSATARHGSSLQSS